VEADGFTFHQSADITPPDWWKIEFHRLPREHVTATWDDGIYGPPRAARLHPVVGAHDRAQLHGRVDRSEPSQPKRSGLRAPVFVLAPEQSDAPIDPPASISPAFLIRQIHIDGDDKKDHHDQAEPDVLHGNVPSVEEEPRRL